MNNVKINDLQKVDEGFIHVCEAVCQTLGAQGKLAIIEDVNPVTPPSISKDGYSVAMKIRFEDKFQNFGAFFAKQVVAKVLAISGDSSSTSLCFSKSFLQNFTDRSKFNKSVEKGLNIAHEEFLTKLAKYAKPVDRSNLEKIAIVACNNDEKLGKLIVEAYDNAGLDGIVNVNRYSTSDTTTLEVLSGMKVDSGMKSPFFLNNEQNATWEATDVLVAVLEVWMSNEDIKQFISDNRYKEDGKTLQPMLLVMEKCEDAAFVQDLEKFAQRKLYNICMITAPSAEKFTKLAHLQDIATYTGATIYQNEDDKIVAGMADSVSCTMESTTFLKKNISEDVVKHLENLKSQYKVKEDIFTKERIQRLSGVSCTIHIGGNTSTEIGEIYDRIDDSLRSVKSSLEEGFIAGGGSTLVHISGKMNRKFKNSDEQLGYELLKTVLLEPFKQILKNSNREDKIEEYLRHSLKTYGRGYNATTDKIVNLVSDGIIDSKKSIRVALDSSKSICEKLLSTSVVVSFTN